MKKRHRMGLWMMAAMVCLAASGCGPAVQNKPEEPTQTIQSTQEQPTQTAEGISEERAKEIALAHAGVKEENLSGYSMKKDTEDGQKTYEIEFYVDNTKYEYEISRKDGEILKHETEIKDAKKTAKKKQNASKKEISKQEAKEIALKRAGVKSADISVFSMKKDMEDGRPVYEGEFVCGQVKYEFEIDAETGKVLSWEKEKR